MSPMLKRSLSALVGLSLAATACGSDDDPSADAAAPVESTTAEADPAEADAPADAAAATDACGAGASKVGFLYVGPKDDFGYNQAAYEAAVAMGEATGV